MFAVNPGLLDPLCYSCANLFNFRMITANIYGLNLTRFTVLFLSGTDPVSETSENLITQGYMCVSMKLCNLCFFTEIVSSFFRFFLRFRLENSQIRGDHRFFLLSNWSFYIQIKTFYIFSIFIIIHVYHLFLYSF